MAKKMRGASRRGAEYQIEILWRRKPLKRSGVVVWPGQAFIVQLGAMAELMLVNRDTKAYAHVKVRHGVGSPWR